MHKEKANCLSWEKEGGGCEEATLEVIAWTYYSKKRMRVCVVLSGDKEVKMCCKSKVVLLLGTCQYPAHKKGDISLQFGRNQQRNSAARYPSEWVYLD